MALRDAGFGAIMRPGWPRTPYGELPVSRWTKMSGWSSAICSRRRVGPSGSRAPCSHARTALALAFSRSAKTCCDTDSSCRIARTCSGEYIGGGGTRAWRAVTPRGPEGAGAHRARRRRLLEGASRHRRRSRFGHLTPRLRVAHEQRMRRFCSGVSSPARSGKASRKRFSAHFHVQVPTRAPRSCRAPPWPRGLRPPRFRITGPRGGSEQSAPSSWMSSWRDPDADLSNYGRREPSTAQAPHDHMLIYHPE